MRSKILLVSLMVACLFSLGCGGGGGDGGGAVTPTTVAITGSTELPSNGDAGWAASIKAAINPASWTAQAINVADGTNNGDAAFLNSSGGFTLNVTPNKDIYVKILNPSKTLDFYYSLGTISAAQAITVNATSTAQYLLSGTNLATDSAAIAKYVSSFLTLLASAPALTASNPLSSYVKTQDKATIDNWSTGLAQIVERNNAIGNYLQAKNLTSALQYFSTNFGTNIATLTSVISLDNFKTTTESRLAKYTINSYSFTISSITFTAADTASVVVNGSITVTDSAGLAISKTLSNWTVIWKYEGSWVVLKDFPYLKEQIGINL